MRRTPFGDSSLVVHVLTPRSGRVELVAKGAYRAKSRFTGVLDWFDELQLEWTARPESRSEGLSQLRTGGLSVRRRALTRAIPLYRAAQTMTELTEIVTRSGAADASHFQLLSEGLDTLDRLGPIGFESSDAPVDSSGSSFAAACLAAFELRLLEGLGVAPSMTRCAICGGSAPPLQAAGQDASHEDDRGEPRAAFSAAAGGRLCQDHAQETRARGLRVGTLPAAVLDAADRLLTPVPMGKAALGVPGNAQYPGLPVRLLDFAARFFDHQLEARPRSHARLLSAPDRNRRFQ